MSDPSTNDQRSSDEAPNRLITCSYCGGTFPIELMSNQDNDVDNERPICRGCRSQSEGLEYRQRMEEELPEGEELKITTIDDPLGPGSQMDSVDDYLPDEHDNQNRG